MSKQQYRLGEMIKTDNFQKNKKKFGDLFFICKFALPTQFVWCWFGSSAG